MHILYIIVQHIRNPSRRLSLSLLQRYIIEADPLIIDYYYYYYYYYFVVSERLARSRRQHMSHEEAEPAACPIQTFWPFWFTILIFWPFSFYLPQKPQAFATPPYSQSNIFDHFPIQHFWPVPNPTFLTSSQFNIFGHFPIQHFWPVPNSTFSTILIQTPAKPKSDGDKDAKGAGSATPPRASAGRRAAAPASQPSGRARRINLKTFKNIYKKGLKR